MAVFKPLVVLLLSCLITQSLCDSIAWNDENDYSDDSGSESDSDELNLGQPSLAKADSEFENVQKPKITGDIDPNMDLTNLSDAELAQLFREIDAQPLRSSISIPKAADPINRGFPEVTGTEADPLEKALAELTGEDFEGEPEPESDEFDDWAKSDDGEGDTGKAYEKFLTDNKELLDRDEGDSDLDDDYEAETGTEVKTSDEENDSLESEEGVTSDLNKDTNPWAAWPWNTPDAEAPVKVIKINLDLSSGDEAPQGQGRDYDQDMKEQQELNSQVQEMVDSMRILDALQKELESLQAQDQPLDSSLSYRQDTKVNDNVGGIFWPLQADSDSEKDDGQDIGLGINVIGHVFTSDSGDDSGAGNGFDEVRTRVWERVMVLDKMFSLVSIVLVYLLIFMAIRCCVQCRRGALSHRNAPQLTIIRIDGQQLRESLATHLNHDKVPLVHSSANSNYSPLPCYFEEKPPTYNEAVTVESA